jgi:hypothetical protein
VEERDLLVANEAVEVHRQVDHRVLQTLAPVNGDDLHRLGVALQPPRPLAAAAVATALPAEPLQQRGQAKPLAVGDVVQHLADVVQVGEVTLAARTGQHPLGQSA